MSLKKSLFVLSACCLLVSFILLLMVMLACKNISDRYPTGGIVIGHGGNGALESSVLEQPTPRQRKILYAVDIIELLACIILPAGGLGVAWILFYRIKLKAPIAALRDGTERILRHDLDFSIETGSEDEMGELCKAFETMRMELLKTNRKLWRQAEERKRLNAAFSHDLRNPVTILKGTVKLLRQGKQDDQAMDRLENYALRIENYIEAMSSIQRLEQMPVRPGECVYSGLRVEIEETMRLLAPSYQCGIFMPEEGSVWLDHGIFLNILENLVGNAARFAKEKITVNIREELKEGERFVILSVQDDGFGYPAKLVQDGPKPFGKIKEEAEHLGMGLYSCQVLCLKHGGRLELENVECKGAAATAVLKTCM